MKTFNLSSDIKYILKCLIKNIIYHDLTNNNYFNYKNKKPYIIGISGSVASGKSTFSHWLQKALKKNFVDKSISVVTTDSFLYSNKTLKLLGLLGEKGFPKTYNINELINFFLNIKYGVSNSIVVPIYSHFCNDIILDRYNILRRSDIFIIEGLHIFNPYFYEKIYSYFSLSDFFNFSVYIDADDILLEEWYLNRFLRFRCISKSYPSSCFNFYSKISYKNAKNIAIGIWYEINYKNLKENIFISKKYANFVITKKHDHSINCIQLRYKNNIRYY
ncbi:MAG: type I pantothenate kinase [Buchnera aphidicola (Schlechtendalia peitan)]